MAEPIPAWQHVAAGSKTTFAIPIVVRASGAAVELPVMVARGARPGKTLLVTSLVHGDEFEGPAAIWRLWSELDPAALQGTVVAVPVVNPPAYDAALRLNPDDRQDLARSFPGDPQGTVTEQIAYALTHRFIRHADLLCDLHSAGQYYAMPPLVGYMLCAEPLLSLQRTAARAFGLPTLWGTPYLPGRSLSSAHDFGVAGIYAEITGEGRARAADVAHYLHGLRQLLAVLDISGRAPDPYEPRWVVEDDRKNAGFLQVQNRAPCGGYFDAEVGVWEAVQCGQRVGAVRDTFGNVCCEVTAPSTGRVVFLRTYPRVLAGDPLCTVMEMTEP
jgi:predicted deacylase